MNWLRKLSKQADHIVSTLDGNLQQPVTDALLFKPLHQETDHPHDLPMVKTAFPAKPAVTHKAAAATTRQNDPCIVSPRNLKRVQG